jgi:hypothetical protein
MRLYLRELCRKCLRSCLTLSTPSYTAINQCSIDLDKYVETIYSHVIENTPCRDTEVIVCQLFEVRGDMQPLSRYRFIPIGQVQQALKLRLKSAKSSLTPPDVLFPQVTALNWRLIDKQRLSTRFHRQSRRVATHTSICRELG